MQTKSLFMLFAGALFLCCMAASAVAEEVDFGDIYARSRELPEEREVLESITFQIHPNPKGMMQRRTVTNSTFNSGHSLTLSFKALQREFSASLHHNAEVFHPQAVVSILSEGELVESYAPESNAYLGEATIDGRERASVSAVLVDREKGIFHMSIMSEEESGDSYVVEPTYLHPTLSKRSSEDSVVDMLGNNMVVFKDNLSELSTINPPSHDQDEHAEREEQAAISCGTVADDVSQDDNEEQEEVFGDASATRSCPPTRTSYLLMGVATDNQYVRKAGGSTGTRNTVTYIFNTMQGHYYRAVRNKPVLKSLVINTSPSSSSFSSSYNTNSCPSDVQTRLTPFCNWRTKQTDRSIGLWHLLSGCLPDRSGVAGRAYYSAVCRYTTRGCGITGYMGGNARWVIPAHEIGHNFGARHSSNIMAASVNSRATAFSSTSVREMCSYTFSNSYRMACLVNSLPSGLPSIPGVGDDNDDDCECRTRASNHNNKAGSEEESSSAAPTVGLMHQTFF
ncbi:Sanke disintergrin [Balamuthia mandrillaris]